MNKLLFCLPLVIFTCISCSESPDIVSKTTVTEISTGEEGCPEKPGELNKKEVKGIELNEELTQEFGIAHKSRSIAYTFEAQEGQKLDYQVNKDICIWIYTPDNELLRSAILPQTGKYTIQVSAIKASTTFDLEMSLQSAQASSTVKPNSLPVTSQSSSSAQSTEAVQSKVIGWIWLGAVDNTSGTFSYREPLIPTIRQPVTITPSVVPVPGEVVTLKTGVNLRRNVPQPPNFELAEKVSNPLTTGQQIVISRVEGFVDTNSDIAKTRIWAEVSSP